MRRFALLLSLVLIALVSCEYRDSPTAPSAERAPNFDFGGGFGGLLGSTSKGELVSIDLDAGTMTLIGDVGVFEGAEPGWTDIAFEGAGRLYALSRPNSAPFGEHLYEIDPSTGAGISDVGDAGSVHCPTSTSTARPSSVPAAVAPAAAQVDYSRSTRPRRR